MTGENPTERREGSEESALAGFNFSYYCLYCSKPLRTEVQTRSGYCSRFCEEEVRQLVQDACHQDLSLVPLDRKARVLGIDLSVLSQLQKFFLKHPGYASPSVRG